MLHVHDILAMPAFQFDKTFLKLVPLKYEIYIGDSPNYWENTKCNGGPFLDPDNSETYVYYKLADDNFAQPFGPEQD